MLLQSRECSWWLSMSLSRDQGGNNQQTNIKAFYYQLPIVNNLWGYPAEAIFSLHEGLGVKRASP